MLSSDYILGFVEGEGCFSIALGRNIDRRPRLRAGKPINIKNPFLFSVRPSFRVTNIEANRSILEEIQQAIGVGGIYIQARGNNRIQNAAHLYTKSVAECLKVRDYFKGLTFRTKKGADFALWCKCLDLMEQGKHLTKEGLLEICRLRDQMNFRPTKNKWSTEEIRKILEENPTHFTAHFDPDQQPLIHNKEGSAFDVGVGWRPGKGTTGRTVLSSAPKSDVTFYFHSSIDVTFS